VLGHLLSGEIAQTDCLSSLPEIFGAEVFKKSLVLPNLLRSNVGEGFYLASGSQWREQSHNRSSQHSPVVKHLLEPCVVGSHRGGYAEITDSQAAEMR